MPSTLYPNWQATVMFSPAGPQPQVLPDTGQFKVLLAGLEPGQKIPPRPAAAAMYHVLAGSGWGNVDGARFAVCAGATMVMPAGAA